MSTVFDSIEDVQQQASRHQSVLVACSFGKDSLVVLDLCCKYFQRVEAFCMSYVLGLEVVAKQIQYAKNRWNVDVKEVEHFGATRQRVQGYRCFPEGHDGPLPSLKSRLNEQKQAMQCSLSATGTRAAESLGRRAGLRRREQGIEAGAWPGDWHPIAWWNRAEVLAYLRNNDIPIPEGSDKDMQGLSNDTKSILWLHDNHPADYQRWLEVFPLASCVVKRRELYGIGREVA